MRARSKPFHSRSRLSTAIAVRVMLITVGTGSAGTLSAQTPAPATTPEEVIVTGSKMQRSAGDLTQMVSIIGEAEIEQQGFITLTEVLRNEASIEFKSAGTPGQFNYPKMRGFASGHILVVIDGVKINDASSGDVGNVLGQIDPDSIERIEILRGPQATLYGSNSTAGVLSITTKSGQNEDMVVRAEAGSLSFGSVGASARGSTGLGTDHTLSYSLNYEDTTSGGVNPLEFTDNETVQGKLKWQKGSVALGGSYWRTDNHFGYAELDELGSPVSTREQSWAFQTPDPHSSSATVQEVSTLFAEHTINEQWRHKLTLGLDEKSVVSEDLDDGILGYVSAPFDNFADFSCDFTTIYDKGDLIPVCDSYFAGVTDNTNKQANYDINYSGEIFDVLVGAEYFNQETYSTSNFSTYGGGQTVRSLYTNASMDILASRGVLSAGVRRDDYNTWGAQTTGSLGMAYDLTDNLNLFANVGSSFSTPSSNHLFGNRGSPDLQPEEGETWELGLRGERGALSGNVTVWRTQLDNVIAYDGALPNPNSPTGRGLYINRDEQLTRGVEVELAYQLTEQLELQSTYTYTDSEQRRGDTWFRTVQIADHKANVGFRYHANNFNVGLNAYYTGPRLDWRADLDMYSYTRVDLNGSYSFGEHVRLYGRVENLFDKDIEEGMGYKQPGVYGVVGLEYRL